MNALVSFTPQQTALIKRTVAKDANDTEFNLFIEMCKARGLNPLVRHAYCFIFHKDNPAKRQMTIVVSREGQRSVAERTNSYRPDERATRYDQDDSLKNANNPAGLISAEVSVYKHSHGEWFPVPEVVYWEEAAPLKEIWENNKPTGKFQLDPKKDGWRRMPRLMLAKCAEMAALRKAFPDDFSGLYAEAEMDCGEALDLSPSEWAEKAEQEDRITKLGGPNQLIIDWMDGKHLDTVPAGQFYDRAIQFLATCEEQPSAVRAWKDRNRASLQQFWSIAASDALELKKEIEKAEAPAETGEAA